MENWKPAVGYEGIYEVSDHGDVRRIAYFDPASASHHGHMLFKKMKQTKSDLGYFRIKLMNHGQPKMELVHRLVAKAFIDNPDHLPCINHIDGNKENNHVSNLEWCTMKYNDAHAYTLGLRVMKNKKGSKPVGMFDAKNGNLLRTFLSTHDASRETGFPQSHIWKNCAGKSKFAHGYVWKYL